MHLWVGILTGLYIAVVSITGAALVFRIDLQRALHPQLFTPAAAGPLLDAASVLEKLRDIYPDGQIAGVDAPTTGRPTYLAYVGQGGRFLTLLLDPVSGQVLGELPERSIIRTLQELHFNLLAGRTGRAVNGAGALCLLIMCVTGAIIWWPGRGKVRRSLTVDRRRSWKRINWELHGAVGAWSAAALMMWAVTGLSFTFPAAFTATVNAVSPITTRTAPQSGPAAAVTTATPSWRTLIEQAQRRMPGQFVARVVVPSAERAAFLVMFSPVSPTRLGSADLAPVYLDQFSAEVLAEPPQGGRTIGDIVMAWVTPLHVGGFGSIGLRLLWLMLGLTPPLLFATGVIMWWARVVKPRLRAPSIGGAG